MNLYVRATGLTLNKNTLESGIDLAPLTLEFQLQGQPLGIDTK